MLLYQISDSLCTSQHSPIKKAPPVTPDPNRYPNQTLIPYPTWIQDQVRHDGKDNVILNEAKDLSCLISSC